jgi:hypothetical protein
MTDVMECGEICCEYCTKDKCIYMKDGESDEAESEE